MPQFVPKTQKLTRSELDDIEFYFVFNSENEVAPDDVFPSELSTSSRFAPATFAKVPRNRFVSAVKIDEQNKRVYLANGSGKNLLEYSLDGKPLAIHQTKNTQAIGIHPTKDGFIATLIGDMFALKEFGTVMVANRKSNNKYNYRFPVQNYYRMAHCLSGDVDGDGQTDFLTSGFGSSGSGAFSIFFGSSTEPHRLDLVKHCGPVSSALYDADGDGDQDVFLITAQGFHDLWFFENLGDRKFRTRRLWKTKPGTGTTSMQLVDLDGDNRCEILITTGNNFEMIDPPIRPYHGIYVYKDSGDLNYEQKFFFPLPNAVTATTGDFDNDGNVDIVATSYLPDWRIEKPVSPFCYPFLAS